MNKSIILGGIVIFLIGLMANIPSIILGMVGSPITSEGDAMNLILDELENTPVVEEGPPSQDIISNAKDSINLLSSVPIILMVVGISILLLGLFIPK